MFGPWVLPLGVALPAEETPVSRHVTARTLAWLERRRPAWFARSTG